MPVGTAFLFPSVTGLLSRIVARRERGVFLGVQQTFGGVGRVAFPLLAGFMMDRYGGGSPFAVAGILVLATLPLTVTLNLATGNGQQATGTAGKQ
jgi:MFS family permease